MLDNLVDLIVQVMLLCTPLFFKERLQTTSADGGSGIGAVLANMALHLPIICDHLRSSALVGVVVVPWYLPLESPSVVMVARGPVELGVCVFRNYRSAVRTLASQF
jgi:hypothetical protein